MKRTVLGALLLGLAVLASGAGMPSLSSGKSWPRYRLAAENAYQLNLPQGERFDASALLLTPKGDLLTLSDRGAAIYRIQFLKATNVADLVLLPDRFTEAQLAPFAREKSGRYDCEGLAQDELGRIYECEEANRWILRWDPRTRKVERLSIDWSPVKKYFSRDPNASFEGIAVANGQLFVANERQLGRIIVVDLNTLRITDHFVVRPYGCEAHDVHYSDLCWYEGALYALMRESSVVVKVDPGSRRVLAEYDFHEMEESPEFSYHTLFPTSTMEGIALDEDYIWLVTDNNGLGRVRYPHDIRPTLFKCPRPDRRP